MGLFSCLQSFIRYSRGIRNRRGLVLAHNPCRSHTHHWQTEQMWSSPAEVQRLWHALHHSAPQQWPCRSFLDQLDEEGYKQILRHPSLGEHINNGKGDQWQKLPLSHQRIHIEYRQYRSLPSVSGSSLYPTSFLSTGTTIPAPWNVLVTTYGITRALSLPSVDLKPACMFKAYF